MNKVQNKQSSKDRFRLVYVGVYPVDTEVSWVILLLTFVTTLF